MSKVTGNKKLPAGYTTASMSVVRSTALDAINTKFKRSRAALLLIWLDCGCLELKEFDLLLRSHIEGKARIGFINDFRFSFSFLFPFPFFFKSFFYFFLSISSK